jgi:hypothetical protein
MDLVPYDAGVLLLLARLAAPESAEPEPPPPAERNATVESVSPFEDVPPAPVLPVEGVGPLQGPSPAHRRAPDSPLPPAGTMPLARIRSNRDEPGPPPKPAMPLGRGPTPIPPEPLDPKTTRLVRVDAMVGPVWRTRAVDPVLTTNVEFGRMHGFLAAFHTAMIVVTNRGFVRAFDFPIGVGVVAQGKLRDKPFLAAPTALYGSVGLTAGILVHRAARDVGVIHRVDPDFRLPLRMAWTVAGVGASLAVVPAYSVRDRVYERRGSEVLRRDAFRIGFVLGLHWDIMAGRAKARRFDRRRDGGQ